MIVKNGHRKPVTLQDIATLAGVNRRTVRDAIQGTGRVAPATREKVLRITRELNYIPNASARALAKGRTGRVVILSGSLNDQYNANAVHLLETHLSKHGYETMLVQSRAGGQESTNTAKASLSDGVIAIGIQQLSDEVFASDVIPPWVLIDTSAPGFIDHITLDFRPAVEEALHLMLATGRERIAYVACGWTATSHTETRAGTYLDLMKEAGHATEIINMPTDVPPKVRVQAIKSYIQENGCPGALFCMNDETAIYTYNAIVGSGYRVPDDAMIVGCDGLPYLEYFDTPLSTIALPMDQICEIAAGFLHKRIADPSIPVQQQIVTGRLIIRKSLSEEDSL
jgi:LacI family transcriptional regulator